MGSLGSVVLRSWAIRVTAARKVVDIRANLAGVCVRACVCVCVCVRVCVCVCACV